LDKEFTRWILKAYIILHGRNHCDPKGCDEIDQHVQGNICSERHRNTGVYLGGNFHQITDPELNKNKDVQVTTMVDADHAHCQTSIFMDWNWWLHGLIRMLRWNSYIKRMMGFVLELEFVGIGMFGIGMFGIGICGVGNFGETLKLEILVEI
jgi:hypothetical protein